MRILSRERLDVCGCPAVGQAFRPSEGTDHKQVGNKVSNTATFNRGSRMLSEALNAASHFVFRPHPRGRLRSRSPILASNACLIITFEWMEGRMDGLSRARHAAPLASCVRAVRPSVRLTYYLSAALAQIHLCKCLPLILMRCRRRRRN